MTALSANKWMKDESPAARVDAYPVKDNVHIYKGSLVNFNGGYAAPAADTSGDLCVGIAEEEADNTITGHTAGGIKVRVRSGTRVLALVSSGLAQTDVGSTVMVTDSATVAKTSTNSVHVGRIVFFNSATSVDVFIPACGVGS